VALEVKREHELVSPVTNVELDVLELHLKHDHVERRLYMANGRRTEHGEHVQSDVEQVHKRENDCATTLTDVATHAEVVQLKQGLVELPL